MWCQHDIESARRRVTVSRRRLSGLHRLKTSFFASAMSSQHDTVSTINRVNTKPCQHDTVSKRRRDNTKYRQYDIVSRRHRAITTPCQGDTVSIRRRVETNVVSRRRPAKTTPRKKKQCRVEKTPCQNGTVPKTSSCHHHAVSKTTL